MLNLICRHVIRGGLCGTSVTEQDPCETPIFVFQSFPVLSFRPAIKIGGQARKDVATPSLREKKTYVEDPVQRNCRINA